MERAIELPDMGRRNCATCGRDCDECWPTRVEKCMAGGGAWIPPGGIYDDGRGRGIHVPAGAGRVCCLGGGPDGASGKNRMKGRQPLPAQIDRLRGAVAREEQRAQTRMDKAECSQERCRYAGAASAYRRIMQLIDRWRWNTEGQDDWDE